MTGSIDHIRVEVEKVECHKRKASTVSKPMTAIKCQKERVDYQRKPQGKSLNLHKIARVGLEQTAAREGCWLPQKATNQGR